MSSSLAVGLMSGTSLDGVDAALVRIKEDEFVKLELLEFITMPFEEEILSMIKKGLDEEQSNNELLCRLNVELGQVFSQAVIEVCKKAGIETTELDFIASHGQTIYHVSKHSSLQLGEPSVIAYNTKVPVISNFRTMDIAAGGEGAPLVPFFDYEVFRQYKKDLVLLNIGGIGNITYVPSSGNIDEVYAFDTGPGNMIINELMEAFYNKPYDASGEVAFKGSIHDDILNELLSHPYILSQIPKSTGREMFGKAYCHKLVKKYDISKEDLIATVSAFTSRSIALNILRYVQSVDEVIVSGGGVYNDFIMKDLQEALGDIPVSSSEKYGISPDGKEAMAFALLGYRTWTGRFSNVKSATGAGESVVLGSITKV